MSIYRTLDRCPANDVYVPEERRLALVPSPTTSPVDIERDKYQHLRKATPANVAFPRTLAWIESLPSDVQPKALVQRYARIANLIAAMWPDRQWFHGYMESLLTDTRGNRQGFPPDVLKDLLALRSYYDDMEKNPQTWTAVGKRGQVSFATNEDDAIGSRVVASDSGQPRSQMTVPGRSATVA